MPPLIIPGVQVTALFEPSPVLPGATGILGIVGVADRGPFEPTAVGNMAEFLDVFGPASRFTMPEVRTAFTNGVAEVVVSRIGPDTLGQKASLTLKDDDEDPVVVLRARAEGKWGEDITARFTQVRTGSGKAIKYVNLDLFLKGTLVESFQGLVMDEESPNYLFDRINSGSRLVVAYDAQFLTAPPAAADDQPFTPGIEAAALPLKNGSTTVINATAKTPGRKGNDLFISVTNGPRGVLLLDTAGAPSIDIRESTLGTASVSVDVKNTAAPFDFFVGTTKKFDFSTLDELVAGLAAAGFVGEPIGTQLPKADGLKPLTRRVNITVRPEGDDPRPYENKASAEEIAAINDPQVAFARPSTTPPSDLPGPMAETRLIGGRDQEPALLLPSAASAESIVELTPADAELADATVTITSGANDTFDIAVRRGDTLLESIKGVSMDPDDPRYLVPTLAASNTLRARDLYLREKAHTLPKHMSGAFKLLGGQPPLPDDYLTALDRLDLAEEVDLVLASTATQLDDAAALEVQKAVVAHCTKMSDVARNRIGLGSIFAAENDNIPDILGHADDVRSDHFILVAPHGAEAALAGLLGRMDYFRSPTFKTIATPDVALVTYTDTQLGKLITGNVAVISKKSGLGVINVKGLLTSGRQINVQRTANKVVRDVKAIADVYIGLLNNEGTRNALRQQIIADLLQKERDGALVPSTDGTSPAFQVDVYSTAADFTNGIVRIDVACRPVRAIDYVYATILVQN